MISQYIQATKNWIKSTSGSSLDEKIRQELKIEKERELIMTKMRAQYLILDPFIRGRGAYHRHGNIVGNVRITSLIPATLSLR